MTSITQLPCELVAAILSNLGSLHELINALVVCRHFYTSFKEHPSVAGDIVLSFFEPELLPLAVAAERVSTLPTPRTAVAVRDFVDGLARSDRRLVSQMRSMPLRSLYSIIDTEDSITDLAFDMAERAWNDFDLYISRPVSLSPAEASRFIRAFYRTEIFFRAFCTHSTAPDPEVIRQSQLWLIMSFAQFEIEQIACVHDYLERVLVISEYLQ